MAAFLPFVPLSSSTTGQTVALAVASATSVNTTMTLARGATSMLVTNGASVLMYVRISDESVPVAASTDVPIQSGAQILLGAPGNRTIGIATVSSSTSGTVLFTPGE